MDKYITDNEKRRIIDGRVRYCGNTQLFCVYCGRPLPEHRREAKLVECSLCLGFPARMEAA